jgi:hypothetical protein
MGIGHRRVSGRPIPLYKILEMILKCEEEFSRHFIGGWHFPDVDGFYRGSNGRLLHEPSSIVASLAPEVDAYKWAQLKALASSIAFDLSQESVLLARYRLLGEMELVAPFQIPLKQTSGSHLQVLRREEKIAS